MSNSKKKAIAVKKIGNYTKNAVESFENNIVNQTNYLEKVKKDEMEDKFNQEESKNNYSKDNNFIDLH
ncbi:hypothetical protein ACOAKC_09155 [Hathewaya histolytica]|uniref:hypothetical protein n=1 Tax=Hathewaya histolytica TaxID=1498 RepID=UPI003B6729C6